MKNLNLIVQICLTLFVGVAVYGQNYTSEEIEIWGDQQPPFNKENITVKEQIDLENKRFTKISKPIIKVYHNPEIKEPAPALLYIPGGGYANVSMGTDRGASYAKLFFKMGFSTVAVLKYRLPDNEIVDPQEKAPLCDAQQAFALMHRNAKAWNIDRSKIGVKGASAGGHLAASLNNLTDEILAPGVKPEELKQAFSVLRVPVLSFNEPYRHKGSFKRLLGQKSNDQRLLDYYSMEQQVNSKTPPTFMVVATDDQSVPYQNSVVYSEKLKAAGIPYKYVELKRGGHTFGLSKTKVDREWTPDLEAWLHTVIEF